MKIAIMMRAMDQDSGFHGLTDGLVDALLNLGGPHTYLLIYRTPKYYGRFSSYGNATELLLPSRRKMIWDQVVVPHAAWKYQADVIYNPKFTVPLSSRCATVMCIQEPSWWARPADHEQLDVWYQKVMLPVYLRRASHLTSMTHWDLEETRKYVGVSPDKFTVTYAGVHRHLRRVTDEGALNEFRVRHRLPDKFILSMTKVDYPGQDKSRKWNPGKNPHTSLSAFLLCRDRIPHDLVVAGRNVRNYFLANGFEEADLNRVHFVDFIPFEEIQKIYTLADLILVPSYYESFSLTMVGAMACGCPAIASTSCGMQEVAKDGALYADPDSPQDLADKIRLMIADEGLRKTLRTRALEIVSHYTWKNAAKETLRAFEKAAMTKRRSRRKASRAGDPKAGR